MMLNCWFPKGNIFKRDQRKPPSQYDTCTAGCWNLEGWILQGSYKNAGTCLCEWLSHSRGYFLRKEACVYIVLVDAAGTSCSKIRKPNNSMTNSIGCLLSGYFWRAWNWFWFRAARNPTMGVLCQTCRKTSRMIQDDPRWPKMIQDDPSVFPPRNKRSSTWTAQCPWDASVSSNYQIFNKGPPLNTKIHQMPSLQQIYSFHPAACLLSGGTEASMLPLRSDGFH